MDIKNEYIEIQGANAHNLKNVSLSIPRGKFVVVTGLSGSGKSSLAFDTIYAEGQRRYMDTLSTYAKHFMGILEKPEVESITGLSPIIAIEQKTTGNNPRSTVGTITEIYDFLRLLYARASKAYSPHTGKEMVRYTDEQIVSLIVDNYKEKIMTHGKQYAGTDFTVNMAGADSSVNLISRSVAKEHSRQIFRSRIVGNASCHGHSECDAIIMDEASVSAIPELTANHIDANLIHEAAIGKIAGEQMIKLMTLGLTEKEAEEQIVKGFLK